MYEKGTENVQTHSSIFVDTRSAPRFWKGSRVKVKKIDNESKIEQSLRRRKVPRSDEGAKTGREMQPFSDVDGFSVKLLALGKTFRVE